MQADSKRKAMDLIEELEWRAKKVHYDEAVDCFRRMEKTIKKQVKHRKGSMGQSKTW